MSQSFFAVLTVLALACGGCIPVPGNYRPVDGSLRPEEKIGKGPGKPLRVSESHRQRVVAVLGPPGWVTPDGRSMVFNYQVVAAWLITLYPIGVAALPHESMRYLHVRFDPDGKLKGYTVFREYRSLTADVGPRGIVGYSAYRKSQAAAPGETPLPPIDADTVEKE